MGTSKIGLKIDRAHNGISELLVENGTPLWTKYVREELREDCKHIIGLDEGSGTSIVIYTATDVGEIYTIASSISGRTSDFIAASIYCPLDIDISGEDLSGIIEATRQEILANRLNEDRLHELFSAEYQTVRVPKVCVPTDGSNYAVRYFGPGEFYDSLSELLNCNMMQPENRNYKGIFLIDRKSGLSATEDCVDVSKIILKESYIIEAPGRVLGYQAYYNGRPFVMPIRMTKGDKLAVVWKKEGFKDVCTETVIESRDTKLKTVTEADERLLIGLGDFAIFDEEGLVDKRRLTIKVGETEINPMLSAAVHVSRLSSCIVTICGKGYKTFRGQVDLRRRPVRIRLEEETFVYKCRIPLDVKSGVKAKCTAVIESNVPLKHSPIRGYRSESGFYPEDTVDLHYKSTKNYKKIIIIACIAFLVGIVIGAADVAIINHKKIKGLEKQVASLVASSQGGTSDRTSGAASGGRTSQDEIFNKAAKYLDENQRWVKSEMENIEGLHGVWDALNSYEYDMLKNREELRNASKNFKSIIDLFNGLDANSLSELKKHPYCTGQDVTITYYKYLGKLNTSPASNPGGSKGSNGNENKGGNGGAKGLGDYLWG